MIARTSAFLVAAVAVASCSTAPEPVQRNAEAERELTTLLAGKVSGPPVSCLESYLANDQRIIDGRTIAYRVGWKTTYLMHLTSGCHLLGSGSYALLTHQFGGMGMCSGDIAYVIDTLNHFTVGSCGIDKIVPYRAPGSRY